MPSLVPVCLISTKAPRIRWHHYSICYTLHRKKLKSSSCTGALNVVAPCSWLVSGNTTQALHSPLSSPGDASKIERVGKCSRDTRNTSYKTRLLGLPLQGVKIN